MTDLSSLHQVVQLAERDLKIFAAKYSGYPNNDKHIEESQTIISGAKKLLEELKSLD